MAKAHEGHVAYMPRLLTFVRDVVEDDVYVSGYVNVAVGLRWHDGTCVTVHDGVPGGPPTVAVWSSVEAALDGLDAYVSAFAPQRALRGLDQSDEELHRSMRHGDVVGVTEITERVDGVSKDLRALVLDLMARLQGGEVAGGHQLDPRTSRRGDPL